MKFLSVMDPLSALNLPKDTTVGFMNAAAARGHELWMCTARDLYLEGDQTYALAYRVQVPEEDVIEQVGREALNLSELDCVWMRQDPPVDQGYLHATYLLDFANTWVINPPAQLRTYNEKLYALRFLSDTPHTRLSASVDQVLGWLQKNDAPLIVKPLDGYGGLGVFLLHPQDRNARATLELLTDHNQRWVVVQAFLPAARVGDQRVIFIDGEVIGSVLRTPREDDHRGNIHAGGQVSIVTLSDEEQALCARVGDRLKADGIYFAGIDLIGGRLTEVNITSPTGIRELKALAGIDAGRMFIEGIEREVTRRRAEGTQAVQGSPS
jgi:glutathione synthase